MAELSIGDAVGSGFGVIRRHPAAVLIWGLLYMAAWGANFAVVAPTDLAMLAELARNAASHAPTPDMSNFGQMQAMDLLLSFVSVFVFTVLSCAVFRTLIHPDQSRFGYLRLGMTELMLFLVIVGGYIAFVVAAVILMIPVAIVVGLLVARHATAAAVIVGLLLAVGAVWALGYVALRFCMVGPMMVDDGRLRLSDTWALTKGKAGALFLIALCLFGMLILLELVVGVAMIIGFSVLSGGADPTSWIPALLRQPPAAVLSRLAPIIIIAGVAGIPLNGAFLAIFSAPWARAYLDFRVRPAAVS